MTRPEGARTDTGAQPVTAQPRGSWSTRILALLTVALLAGFGIGWGVDAWVDSGPSAQPNAGVTIDNLANNPSNWYGSTVVVSGQISSLYSGTAVINNGSSSSASNGGAASSSSNSGNSNSSNNSPTQATPAGFTLSSQVFVTGNSSKFTELMNNPQLATGAIVQVIGTVHKLNVGDINSQFGTNYGNGVFGGFNGPAIYASQVNLVPVTAYQNKVNVNATVNQMLNNPTAYRFVQVTISGTPSQRLSDKSFVISGNGNGTGVNNNGNTYGWPNDSGWLGNGGNNILVVTPNSTVPQNFSGTVTVTGIAVPPNNAALQAGLNVSGANDVNTALGLNSTVNSDNALQNFAIAVIASNVKMGG